MIRFKDTLEDMLSDGSIGATVPSPMTVVPRSNTEYFFIFRGGVWRHLDLFPAFLGTHKT